MPWTPPLQPPPSAPLTAGAVSSFLWKIAVYLEEEVASNELPETRPSLTTDSNAATSADDISSLLNAPSISSEQTSQRYPQRYHKRSGQKLRKSAAQSSLSEDQSALLNKLDALESSLSENPSSTSNSPITKPSVSPASHLSNTFSIPSSNPWDPDTLFHDPPVPKNFHRFISPDILDIIRLEEPNGLRSQPDLLDYLISRSLVSNAKMPPTSLKTFSSTLPSVTLTLVWLNTFLLSNRLFLVAVTLSLTPTSSSNCLSEVLHPVNSINFFLTSIHSVKFPLSPKLSTVLRNLWPHFRFSDAPPVNHRTLVPSLENQKKTHGNSSRPNTGTLTPKNTYKNDLFCNFCKKKATQSDSAETPPANAAP
ncbi:hypothetical protein GEMRC1_010829 [Eukaryota sp. GEM-RC1]